MPLLMLMLSVYTVATCDASAATLGDACAYVVVFGDDIAAAISIDVVAFNIFVTRPYICTRIVRTARM